MKDFNLLYLAVIACILPASLYGGPHDGWSVTNFNNENGLPQNSVKFAEMDNDGYLWLATEAGIVRYDGQRFRKFDNTNTNLTSNRYLHLGKDNNGRIYCIDDYLQITWYNAQTGFSKPAHIRNLAQATTTGIIDLDRLDLGKLEPYVKRYPFRNQDDFFFHPTGKEKGFIVLNRVVAAYVSQGRVRRVDSLDIHRYIVRSIGILGDRLCYFNGNREIVLVDSNGVRSHKKIPVPVPWNKLNESPMNVSFFTQEHQLLLDLDGDIYEVVLNGDELKCNLLVRAGDIPFRYCIRYYPEQGLLIIGSSTKGLFIFKKQQLATIINEQGNIHTFYALAPYGDNQILTRFGVSPAFRPVPGISEAEGRYGMLLDHKRHYWYAGRHSLIETDDQFRILKKVPFRNRLSCVQEDAEGTVWMVQGQKAFGRIQADTFQPYHLSGMEGKSILSFIPAGNQTFWLVGKGLCMWLNVKHGRQRIYHEFDNVELRTAYLDKQGNLWLGSYGQGYFLFRDGRFTKMPEDEAHYLKVVHSFLEDRNGFTWMTTNNGLFQCATADLYQFADRKTERVYHQYYGLESGLRSSEFNGGCTPSGLALPNGRFAFPSMEGIVLFYPDSIQPPLPNSKLFIEELLLDGAPVNNTDLSSIPPAFKRLELTVSSPYFGNPHNLNIQYNIGGLDDRWYPLGENNSIVLNRLKYGKYTLRLRKQAGFGADNYVTAELPLLVKPFFYQTWWLQLLVGICLLSLIGLIIRVRYNYLVLQRIRLEAEVKDRTSALVYHNKLLEKLTVMIAHDLKSPLHFLSKVSGHLYNKVQQENLPGLARTSNDIKNTADQVYQSVDAFSLWASSFSEGFTINKTTFPLDGLLQELSMFFKEMLEANGNRLFIVTPAHFTLDTDRELLKVILRNIIDNANKHGQGCEIGISARTTTDQHICITVTDTGAGMREPILKRIQDRIAQASTAASIERNSRLGYQMIIDFATRLAAKLDVQSEPGKGTTVTLCIPGTINEENPSDLVKQVEGAG